MNCIIFNALFITRFGDRDASWVAHFYTLIFRFYKKFHFEYKGNSRSKWDIRNSPLNSFFFRLV